MEDADRRALQLNRTFLVKNIANPDDVADGLFTFEIFTEGMKDEVEVQISFCFCLFVQELANIQQQKSQTCTFKTSDKMIFKKYSIPFIACYALCIYMYLPCSQINLIFRYIYM